MSFIVPIPPNPDEAQYKGNPLAYNRAQYDWMLKTKGRLEISKPLMNGVAVTTPIPGDITYYANGSGWTRLAAGNPGQVFIQGSSTAPMWGNISSNLASGTGINITGSNTATINTSLAAGTNITITGTATQTIALSSNVTNSFPNRTVVAGTNYNAQVTDYLIAYSTIGTAGNTVNFPSPVGLTNQKWIVKDEGGFAGTAKTITLQSTSGTNTYTFDGASSKIINAAYNDLRIYSNNVGYFTW